MLAYFEEVLTAQPLVRRGVENGNLLQALRMALEGVNVNYSHKVLGVYVNCASFDLGRSPANIVGRVDAVIRGRGSVAQQVETESLKAYLNGI